MYDTQYVNIDIIPRLNVPRPVCQQRHYTEFECTTPSMSTSTLKHVPRPVCQQRHYNMDHAQYVNSDIIPSLNVPRPVCQQRHYTEVECTTPSMSTSTWNMYHAQYVNSDIITWTTPSMSTATLYRVWMYHAQYANNDIITKLNVPRPVCKHQHYKHVPRPVCQQRHYNMDHAQNVNSDIITRLEGWLTNVSDDACQSWNSLECSWTRWNVHELDGMFRT